MIIFQKNMGAFFLMDDPVFQRLKYYDPHFRLRQWIDHSSSRVFFSALVAGEGQGVQKVEVEERGGFNSSMWKIHFRECR